MDGTDAGIHPGLVLLGLHRDPGARRSHRRDVLGQVGDLGLRLPTGHPVAAHATGRLHQLRRRHRCPHHRRSWRCKSQLFFLFIFLILFLFIF